MTWQIRCKHTVAGPITISVIGDNKADVAFSTYDLARVLDKKSPWFSQVAVVDLGDSDGNSDNE